MTELRVEATRGELVETVHRVACAVVRADGVLVARSGDPHRPTWWRSAAKPFQALPLVQDGAADRFRLGSEELALACASHSSEPAHLAVVDRFLAAIGLEEAALACGPHPPLSAAVQREATLAGTVLTPRWSNCSGKHAGMLALARHHGWPIEGYGDSGHPVQRRILRTIVEWTDVPGGEIRLAVDGCAAACFGLPLSGMALAWARLGSSADPAAGRIRDAMLAHPFLIAGSGRPCTAIMSAWPGQVLAKVGAEGVYGAALPGLGVGVAIKVEDGDMKAAAVVLVEVLRGLLGTAAGGPAAAPPTLAPWIDAPILNTRGTVTGMQRAAGALVFLDRGAAIG